jgi:hypothetical protein
MDAEAQAVNCPHQKALVKLLQSCGYRHDTYTVFSDFVEMAALAVSNSIDFMQREEREARYMRIIGKYEKDEQARFPQMLAELTMAMGSGVADHLGRTFGELEIHNSAAGQFFTPYELCKLMARMTLDGDEVRAKIAERGFITAQEPACGAGAQIIAMAEALQELQINYQQCLHVTAIDVDSRAAHMTYLQLSLLGVPAIVYEGNTLTMEMRGRWYTPAHIMGMWDNKLRRGYALGSAMDTRAA